MTHRLTEDLQRLAHENHDNCITCGYKFREGDTSHLGYDADGRPLYVCDQCSTTLVETAIRHYFMPLPYVIPDPDTKLWRYMDFTKYVSLLSTSCLYFARSDTFEDHFEGAKGLMANKKEWDAHYLSFFKHALENPPEGVDWDQSEEHVEKEALRLLDDHNVNGEARRKRVFVSCWHENEYESEAMWRLYSSFLENAVAVRTTYGSLYESLGKDPSIKIGKIEYLDYSQNYAGVNDSFWRKRKSFEHEREVRALILDFECTETGRLLNCDLDKLVEEVYISPQAPGWFLSLMNDVNQKFDMRAPIVQSNLNDQPFY